MRRKSSLVLLASFIGIIAMIIFIKACDGKEKEYAKDNNKSKSNAFVRTANNLPSEMLYADYWISKQNKPDEIIMSQLEIVLWNTQYKNYSFSESELNGRYGYTVKRASIRKEPTNEVVPDESGNELFCQLQVSSILLNEPVVILDESDDGQWYYIRCDYCEGWIEQENVALCENFSQWKSNMNPKDFLLVTGNKEILDVDLEHTQVSELVLHMGTKLELVEYEKYISTEGGRVPYECYVVKVPVRNEEGMLEYSYAFVPVSKDVHIGYLPYTKRNLITQMFKLNGDRYGWGGMFGARDCSQYIMEVYSLFGFRFARNSSAQAEMPFEGCDLESATDDEKKKILDETPIGSILYFQGHVMIYLGEVGGEYYVISETARIATDTIINAHSCMITQLSIKRPNGVTWLRDISMIKYIR